MSHAFQQIHKVALDAQHDRFCFRVTHPAVILYHLGFPCTVDKPEEDEALIVQFLLSQSLNGRAYDALFHFLHPRRIGKRNRRDTAHAACVQPRVSLANAFVIFGFGQDFVVLAVGQYKHRALDAAQELFDDHACRGLSKQAI